MNSKLIILNEEPAAESAATVPQRHPTTADGFAGNVALVTLGCAKNQVDSELMLGGLIKAGFRPVTDADAADLIVVNTCAFLQSAVEEGIDRILELAQYRKSGRCKRLIVAGCMVERYRESLLRELPEVDRFISTDELLSVAPFTATSQECLDQSRRPYFLYDETMPRVISSRSNSAFIKIAEGCDRPCSFCIIPKLRGQYRSRPLESIANEIHQLRTAGICEFNLVAQDLTAYGTDFTGQTRDSLTTLLHRLTVEAVQRNDFFWLRLLYAYPVGVSPELLAQIKESPVICKYLDLPLQHISAPVLKRMHRPLGEKGTRELVELIRKTAPEIALRTTFLVGFPGETDEDAARLCEFVAEGHFTHLGVFVYSPEEEAASFGYDGAVPAEVAEERRARVMACQQAVVSTRLRSFIGERIQVLIEGPHEESEYLLSARTQWQAPETDGGVIINDIDPTLGFEDGLSDEAAEQLAGCFAEVEVTDAAPYDLIGTLVAKVRR